MKKLFISAIFVAIFACAATAQVPAVQASQKATVTQTVGDVNFTITYHRPSINGRKVWGELVPYGKVWRTGANNATVFETSGDVTINGQKLAAGKYSFYAIPTATDWTLIFNKTWDQWGTIYDEKLDALRVTAKPVAVSDSAENLNYEFAGITPTTGVVHLKWEKLRVPFTIDIGDVNSRLMGKHREALAAAKADDFQTPARAAAFVLNAKLKTGYPEALTWIDKSIAVRETFGNTRTKALLLAEMGKTAEAIAAGEKAVALGKASTPPANPEVLGMLEKSIADWKAKK